MKTGNARMTKRVMAVLAGSVAVWGVAGFALGWGHGYPGFFYGPGYTIQTLTEGGAAEAAGVLEGDRVLTMNGSLVESLPMQSRQSQRPIGATVPVSVQRGGEILSFDLTYQPLPANRRIRQVRSHVVNLAFLSFGLWAFLSAGTPLALLLLGFCLARAMAGFPGPHLGPQWEGLAANLQLLAMIGSAFLLLRFFLEVPRPAAILRRGKIQKILWGGLAFSGLVCLAELLVHPTLYLISGFLLLGLTLPAYLPLLVLVPRSWIRCTPEERRETGMSLIMLGFLVGYGPGIIRLIVENLFGLAIPGSDFIPLVEVAVPLFLASAVIRRGVTRREREADSAPREGELQPA
jgi:hypothetical protein